MNKHQMVKVFVSGEEFDFDTVLCAGKKDEDNGPVTFYSGSADLDEVHNALYYINRTVIRTLANEFGIALDDMDDFFHSAISEAFTKENNYLKRHGELNPIGSRRRKFPNDFAQN